MQYLCDLNWVGYIGYALFVMDYELESNDKTV